MRDAFRSALGFVLVAALSIGHFVGAVALAAEPSIGAPPAQAAGVSYIDTTVDEDCGVRVLTPRACCFSDALFITPSMEAPPMLSRKQLLSPALTFVLAVLVCTTASLPMRRPKSATPRRISSRNR